MIQIQEGRKAFVIAIAEAIWKEVCQFFCRCFSEPKWKKLFMKEENIARVSKNLNISSKNQETQLMEDGTFEWRRLFNHYHQLIYIKIEQKSCLKVTINSQKCHHFKCQQFRLVFPSSKGSNLVCFSIRNVNVKISKTKILIWI